MKIALEPTPAIAQLEVPGGGSIPARIWQGVDEHGVEVHAYVTHVAVAKTYPPEVHERFARELQETAPLRPTLGAIDMRFIVD